MSEEMKANNTNKRLHHVHLLKAGEYYLQGSQACIEGAIMAGCRVYGGYPITPASEIMEYASRRLPQVGGRFIQVLSLWRH